MGREGRSHQMITRMRNNRKILRKKGLFKKERSFASIKKEYYKASSGKIDSKKLSKEELLLIRNRVIKRRMEGEIKFLSILIVILASIIVLSIYISNK